VRHSLLVIHPNKIGRNWQELARKYAWRGTFVRCLIATFTAAPDDVQDLTWHSVCAPVVGATTAEIERTTDQDWACGNRSGSLNAITYQAGRRWRLQSTPSRQLDHCALTAALRIRHSVTYLGQCRYILTSDRVPLFHQSLQPCDGCAFRLV